MTRIKILVASLGVLVMLSACGEKFKAKSLSATGGSIEEAFEDDAPVSLTPASEDQIILDAYASDFQRMAPEDVRALSDSIQAFTLKLYVTEHPGGGSEQVRVEATFNTSCQSAFEIESTSLSLAQLSSGSRQNLGSDGTYRINLQCTDSSCDSVVVGLYRLSNPVVSEALVLMELEKGNSFNSGRTEITTYRVTRPQITPFFTFKPGVSQYLANLCVTRGDLTGATTTGTGTVVNPTSGTGFTPISGSVFGNGFNTGGSNGSNEPTTFFPTSRF